MESMSRRAVLSVIMLLFGVTVMACSPAAGTNHGERDTEAIGRETEVATEVITEAATEEALDEQASHVVSPLPTTISLQELKECTVAVSLEEGDVYVDDMGEILMNVKVYVYDLYDMVDMSLLKEGDSIVILEEKIEVTSIERNEFGSVILNGGLDHMGYEFWTDEDGVFYQIGYSDAKSYYPIGEATLKVSSDFEFKDNMDIDYGEKIYDAEDFLKADSEILYYFNPNSTSIVINGDGEVIAMNRIYTP